MCLDGFAAIQNATMYMSIFVWPIGIVPFTFGGIITFKSSNVSIAPKFFWIIYAYTLY